MYNKLYYKLARNNNHMSIENQESLSIDFKKGDEVYIITKSGIEKDKLKKERIYTEKSLFLICKNHRFCAKDIGYTVFATKKEAKKRLKKLRPDVNAKLLKLRKLNLDEAFKEAKIYESLVSDFSQGLDKLEKEYPVRGYEWDYDPNDRMICLAKKIDYNKPDKSLERQINCVKNKHMYVQLSKTIYWCQNCGTVLKTRKQIEIAKRNPFNKFVDGTDEYFYPLNPHFLPKKK